MPVRRDGLIQRWDGPPPPNLPKMPLLASTRAGHVILTDFTITPFNQASVRAVAHCQTVPADDDLKLWADRIGE